MKKPVIGITGRIDLNKECEILGYETTYSASDYVELVDLSGGVPMILPVVTNENLIRAQIEAVDGLLVAGGMDVNPLAYGEEPVGKQGFILEELDYFDITAIKIAYELKKPIFGICRGIQIINVAFGGTLYQDLPSQKKDVICHVQNSRRHFPSHSITINDGTMLQKVLGNKCTVNSYHHQGIKDLAPGLMVSAVASDGIIEAIEKNDTSYIMAVQWHPEMMASKHENMVELFSDFVKEASK